MHVWEGDGPVVPAAGVAIFDRGWERLLLARHAHDGAWATIGGRVEGVEAAEQAARREVAEETGVQLGRLELLGVFGGAPRYTVHYPGWGPTTYSVTMFIGSLTDDELIGADGCEVLELRWFTSPQLSSAPVAEDMFEIIPAALDFANRHRSAR